MDIKTNSVSGNRALVTNSGSLISLAIVRSLARRGLDVYLVGGPHGNPVGSSRGVCQALPGPSSKSEPEEFIDFLEQTLVSGDFSALFPVGTHDTLLVSRYLDRLSRYCRIPFLPYKSLFYLHNKKNLPSLCNGLGLSFPKTCAPESLGDIYEISGEVTYPCVIKLADSTGAEGISYTTGPGKLKEAYAQTVKKYKLSEDELPILQEYIPGTGYGVSCLYNKGERRAFFTHKRIREITPEGGASTCRESIRHAEMEEMAFALLDHLKWHGVAMVEFKMHKDTGKPYILEVNPRFWGSLAAAIAAGVDFPWLLYQMAVEGDIESVHEYALGIRSRCLLTELASLGRHLMAGKLDLLYIKDFMGLHGKKTCWEDFSLEDPLPFFQFILSRRD